MQRWVAASVGILSKYIHYTLHKHNARSAAAAAAHRETKTGGGGGSCTCTGISVVWRAGVTIVIRLCTVYGTVQLKCTSDCGGRLGEDDDVWVSWFEWCVCVCALRLPVTNTTTVRVCEKNVRVERQFG